MRNNLRNFADRKSDTMNVQIKKGVKLLMSKDKMPQRNTAKDYFMIVLGSLIVAVAYVYFFTPHKIVPGGVYGISIMLHHLSQEWFVNVPDSWEWLRGGLPIGMTSLCFNIPLVIIAFKMFGNSYLVRTIVTFVSTAAFTDMLSALQRMTGVYALVEGENDLLLSCLFGSTVFGLGVAMVLKAKGTNAGTDVLAKVATKLTHIPVGYTIIAIDSIIVLMSFFAFGELRIPMYSLFTVIVYGKMVDVFMQGLQLNKAVFIISDHPDEISRRILTELNRGGTFIKGLGMYQGVEKKIIYTVIENKQVVTLREHVQAIDPKAFVTILNANEILGAGFKPIDEKD